MIGYNLLGHSLVLVLYNINGTYYCSNINLSLMNRNEKIRYLSLCGQEMTIAEIEDKLKLND